MNVFFAIFAGIIGTAIGSFLNVCIDRLPRGESIATGRSHCEACSRRIRERDLVPVLSYLALRGRCRECGAPIPRRVVVVEAVTGIMFALLFASYGPALISAVLSVYAAILIVVFVIDLEHGLILNKVVGPAVAVSFIVAVTAPPAWLGELFPHPILSAAAGAASGFAILFVVAVIVSGGMGWGDVKFAAFMGGAVGFPLVFVALFCSVIAGGVVGVALLIARKKGRKQTIPFGPFLTIGTMATLLWGQQMLDWYVGLM